MVLQQGQQGDGGAAAEPDPDPVGMLDAMGYPLVCVFALTAAATLLEVALLVGACGAVSARRSV